MYAIFENGSKQYKVSEGDLLKVEKLNAAVGETVQFPVVLTADDNGIKVGADVAKLTVSAEVISHGKDRKIIVFKYKAKKNERKKQGHRQPFTQIKVTAIGAGTPTAKKAAEPAAKAPAAKKAAAPVAKKTAEPAAKKPAAKKTAEKAE
ncbi:MAG: 50S ribosomal protein L21 [Clostridia bacterium]|nr:50S ribosomal protein L21 [Clostridia bacterium]